MLKQHFLVSPYLIILRLDSKNLSDYSETCIAFDVESLSLRQNGIDENFGLISISLLVEAILLDGSIFYCFLLGVPESIWQTNSNDPLKHSILDEMRWRRIWYKGGQNI